MTPPPGLHEAAVRHLTSTLSGMRIMPELAGTEHERAAGALDALLGVGAITAGEAAEWRARFERAADREPDPDVRRRAIEHLEGLEASGQDVQTAANAFAEARVIESADAQRWRPRWPETAPIGGEEGVLAGDYDESVLRQVVLGPEGREAGLRVTVVELYEAATVVSWHFARDDDDPGAAALWARLGNEDLDEDLDDLDDDAFFHRDEPFALADDLGTPYQHGPSAGVFAPSGDYASGYSGFTPAVPREATHLDVVLGGPGRLRIPLHPPTRRRR